MLAASSGKEQNVPVLFYHACACSATNEIAAMIEPSSRAALVPELRQHVTDDWEAFQGNGTVVAMHLKMPPDGIRSGFVSHGSAAHPESVPSKTNGVSGSVTDTDFHLIVQWSDGPIGQYDGHFALDNSLLGITFNVNNVHEQTTWVANRTFPFRPPPHQA
jgi:hypothetical protein